METYTLQNESLSKKENASFEEFSAAILQQTESGFWKAFENSFENARFVTLTNGEETVNISLKGKKNTLRIVRERGVNLPISEPCIEEKCETLLTQMQNLFFSCDCGMCYSIRLSDGTFVIIDGGMGTYDEPEHFLEILNAQKIGDDAPRIRAWFITHPHMDHFGLFQKLMDFYSDHICLETLIYHWPDKAYTDHWNDTTRFDAIAKKRDGFSVITARTGYQFSFGENVFEILFSPDDILPQKLGNVNDTSLVIRHKFRDKTILYLGDIMTPAADILLEECEADTLRADILQVAHHGFWGASDALYRVIRPKTLLWPIPDYHYYNMSRLPQNDYIVNSGEIEAVFFSSLSDATLNLLEPIQRKEPAAILPYEADFSSKSMMKLGWNCIHKGFTVYRAAKATFIENGIRLQTPEGAPSIVEIIKPLQLGGIKKLFCHIEGEVTKASKFSFVYNYKNPKEIDETKTVPLSVKKGPFSYCIQMDEENKTLTVRQNDAVFFTAPYTPDERHGIAFLLEEAEIYLSRVSVAQNNTK